MNAAISWPSALVHARQQNMATNPQPTTPPEQEILPLAQRQFATQPDLYLQLSQVLECEIMNHNRTRTDLIAEIHRRVNLESQVHKQAQDLAQWQHACDSVYASLDEHRAEAARLKQQLGEMEAELTILRGVCVLNMRILQKPNKR